MIVKLENYNGEYKIVSLALNSEVRDDLLSDNIDFLYISENAIRLYPEDIVISEDEKVIAKLRNAHNYDVYELWENGRLSEYYDDSSMDNYFFVTAKCNSNCIMCPSPDISRQRGGITSVNTLIEIAKHIPADAPHLTITGGEPFMMGPDIFRFFEFLRDKFEDTEFLLLTNGRIFAIDSYVQRFIEKAPNNSIIAIPIHGSTPTTHDMITQADGSFDQTISGIKKLLKVGIHIEIRLVVSKLNEKDIPNIAHMITEEIPEVDYVSIMAMEMTGSARVNSNKVWIPYKDAALAAEKAALILMEKGIDVKLYNFPLCAVKKEFWTLCEKSISPDKVRFGETCENCKMRKACGGIFAGTISLEKGELRAIV